MFGNMPPPEYMLAIAIVLFTAIGFHEYAHCKVADMAGDPTPAFHGRVTLNLTKHFELTGTLMIIFTMLAGYGIGWGKPAPMRPDKMRNPRWDFFMAVAAGPLSNLIQAGIWAIITRLMAFAAPELLGGWFGLFLPLAIFYNIALMLFNLIPLGVLDGHWMIGLLMPEKMRYHWFKFNQQAGVFILIFLVLGSQFMRSNFGWSPLDFIFNTSDSLTNLFLSGL